MSEHTKEPWHNGAYAIFSSKDIDSFVLARRPTESQAIKGDEAWDANARRIVSCVNACEGIDTERLEAGSSEWWGKYVRDDRPAMEREISSLREQRDELLAALNLLVGISSEIDAIERCESWDGGQPEYGTVITFGKIKQKVSKAVELIKKYDHA